MKTITPLLIAITASFSINANADAFYNDPAIDDIFPIENVTLQEQEVTIIEDTGKQVWSTAYEQWVNPADFNSNAKLTLSRALQELENNPPAAGKQSSAVFIWDQTAGEYQLQ
ncbi:MAG: hypothetical protein GQ546_11150 [Gammaproteobacteria bacterium]|nr:hypothetical protein [Gammaproteobacteria bacterium]